MTTIRKVITYKFVDYAEYSDPDNMIVINDHEKENGWGVVSQVGNVTNLEITVTYEPDPIILP